MSDTCTECGSSFEQVRGRGRPVSLCRTCRFDRGRVKEKQRAYRQRPEVKEKQRAYFQRPEVKEKKRAYFQRPEVKEKKRAYRQRPEVKEKKRAYREEIREGARVAPSRWHCRECDEPLRAQTADGLCGFCRRGIAA